MGEASQTGGASQTGADRSSNGVSEKVREIVASQLGVDRSEVTPEANILDDLGADSLDVVELVMALEEAFDVEVPDEDVERLRSIGDVERYIASRLDA